jgi:glycosyltransferase involved in cell wall biosynthesis
VRRAVREIARPVRRSVKRAGFERDAWRARREEAPLSVFHDFAPAPAGGANQTLRAILGELAGRGVRIEYGALAPSTRAVLFNSFNFDVARFELFARRRGGECRMVHRVGAVTTLYRGFDDGTDARVADLNRRYADATIAISQATIEMYRSLGIELTSPRVIYNGVDPSIFNPQGRAPFDPDRKMRLIAVSWSDNPRKGGPVYRWLESVLDWDRYELTYVGNTQEQFKRVRVMPPLPSHELADVLREHDVFVTATQHDAYSNALVEALSCGLPAIYLDSGGSREAVKEAGFGFNDREEIPDLLERLHVEYDSRRSMIDLPTLAGVGDAYLQALGLDEFVEP